MPTCNHCGGHISDDFRRVFSNRDGEVYACHSCSPTSGIAEKSQIRSRSQ